MLVGSTSVHGRSVVLRLELDRSFPRTLPSWYLEPWDACGFIPHVTPGAGLICFLDKEGLLLNRHEPLAIVIDSLALAKRVLEDGVAGVNAGDWLDELDWYWAILKPAVHGRSLVETDDVLRPIEIYGPNGTALWLVDDVEQLRGFPVDEPGDPVEGIYVPLEAGTALVPPLPGKRFWNGGQFHHLVTENLSKENRRRLHRLLAPIDKPTFVVALGVPRPSGGWNLVGIQFDTAGGRHPLTNAGAGTVGHPVDLTRLDRSFLLERGGASTHLLNAKVLVIGCGAVGGHVAFALARGGVRHLTLVDPDVLGYENVFRHILGLRYCGQPKSRALKSAIAESVPYVNVEAIEKPVEVAVEEGQLELTTFDLIISATGDPTGELALNERLLRNHADLRCIYTWLEPLGLGGHSVLVNGHGVDGCLECLYTAVADGSFGENRASFAGAGQHFGKAMLGCGGQFTPYGYVDASRTGEATARMAIAVLKREEELTQVVSWKGSASDFEAAGFRTSDRFGLSQAELDLARYEIKSQACRVCHV